MYNFMPKNDYVVFKAQGLYSKEWYSGYLWRDLKKAYIIDTSIGVNITKHPDGIHDELKAAVNEVKPETISLRSSHTDKNNRYIYAGDIVKFQFCDTDTVYIGTVIYNGRDFLVHTKENHYARFLSAIEPSRMEVIGHCADNKELKTSGFYIHFSIGIPDSANFRSYISDSIDEEKKAIETFNKYIKNIDKYQRPIRITLNKTTKFDNLTVETVKLCEYYDTKRKEN